jgi:hypothetical protein
MATTVDSSTFGAVNTSATCRTIALFKIIQRRRLALQMLRRLKIAVVVFVLGQPLGKGVREVSRLPPVLGPSRRNRKLLQPETEPPFLRLVVNRESDTLRPRKIALPRQRDAGVVVLD